jgi:hypothetical protein
MQHSFCRGGADSRPTRQDIPLLVWNPNVHYRVHNSQPLTPILICMCPVFAFSFSYHLCIDRRSGVVRLIFRPKSVMYLSCLMRAAWPTYVIIFHFITIVSFMEEYKLCSSSLCTLLRVPGTFFPSGPNVRPVLEQPQSVLEQQRKLGISSMPQTSSLS